MERIHADITDLAVDIDSLRPYERNPRRGDIDAITESLRVNGQYRPIVANRGTHTGRPGEILAGNHTWRAAKQLGWTRIAVTWVDVDDQAAARIIAVDNRSNDLAGYDYDELVELLGTLDTLDGTGYTQADIDKLLGTVPDLSEFKSYDDITDAPASTRRVTCPQCGHEFTPGAKA